ncbi:hypothetical protein [Pantoea cypripedii]|uniref:Uncharacterized protein n=1 Tax=Pantoea cypripedii TaxID=55209 RepID=A0A1X1ESX2_PANCY|nr:hypothetical protein [Pantoea cypripedii]MBP2197186.1 hypothetical protein [Pantoea cypripedii]ORM93119.1 hypothetical protein HA50_07075 [Pantoea cypripedii]
MSSFQRKPIVRTSTSAKVTITIEISNLGMWGPDCQISQVYRQAIEEANGKLSKLFYGQDIRVVGTPVVQAISTDVEVR